MKKYLFGLVAVVMAVAFSAFTTPKAAQHQQKEQMLNYWEYSIGGGLGGYLGQYDKDGPLVESGTCPNNGVVDCARGYDATEYGEFTPPVGSQIAEDVVETRSHS